MGGSLQKSPKLILSQALRSPSTRRKLSSDSFERDQRIEFLGRKEEEEDDDENIEDDELGNKVMVVVDSNAAAKGALQWALSHSVQTKDSIILLYVTKTGKKLDGRLDLRANQLLLSLRNMCETIKPGVEVETAVVDGKEENGAIIVAAAKKHGVSLLVLGQKKKSSILRLLKRCIGNQRDVAEYCIHNAPCLTIALRRKSNKTGGGYLITTKRHKNFWLLA